jgi:NhaA family Na+:H+ antiporter
MAGVVLVAAAATAMGLANSPVDGAWRDLLHTPFFGHTGEAWVNEGLMAIFFLLVGLEIKRELVEGQLSTWRRRALPGLSAAGGMIVPALIYVAINVRSPGTLRGWAIPSATDIAFALGVLSLLGPRVPVSLKIFLTALAILDDLGAIAIIGGFYTTGLAWIDLAGAGVMFLALIALNRLRVVRLWIYLAPAVALWWFLQRSGVHATLAGVAVAMTIPARGWPARPDKPQSPLHLLEHRLQPWVAFLVLPVFALVNAGVTFGAGGLQALTSPAPLGVLLGLFLGKQIGVFGSAWLAVRLGLAERPAQASWLQLYGVAVLCGIGFTMSLFIGLLAFPSRPGLVAEVKTATLAASLLSAGLAALILGLAYRKPQADHAP